MSEILKTEIAVLDIRNINLLCFGETQSYDKRIYLLYDGTHYDAMYGSTLEDSGEESLVAVFSPGDESAKKAMLSFAEALKKNNEYIDRNTINVQCKDCLEILKGQKEVAQHGSDTGHRNFSQVKDQK